MKTIAIIHGWAGGPRHTRLFIDGLKKNGVSLTNKLREADVIFAHSAGCYKVPRDNTAKLIVLHGPPYWPGKSMVSRVLMHKRSDTKMLAKNYGSGYVLTKFFWEFVYVIIHPSLTFIGLRYHKHLDFLDELKNKRVLVIRNLDDHFCSPEIQKALKPYDNVKFAELPGEHDDYYTNPQPYIDLLLKELK